MHLVERDGTLAVANGGDLPSTAGKPGLNFARIGYTATEEEQLGVGWSHRQSELIIHATSWVADHLVFVDYEQAWTFAGHECALLSFERCDDDGRIKIVGEVACRNADAPAHGLPFAQLVVSKGTCRYGKDCFASKGTFDEMLEDESFTSTRGCIDDKVVFSS